MTILINRVIRKRELTRTQAAKIMRVDQADASRLLNCRLTRFSIERLFNILNNLGYVIEIRVTDAKTATVKSSAKSRPIIVVKPRSTAAS